MRTLIAALLIAGAVVLTTAITSALYFYDRQEACHYLRTQKLIVYKHATPVDWGGLEIIGDGATTYIPHTVSTDYLEEEK